MLSVSDDSQQGPDRTPPPPRGRSPERSMQLGAESERGRGKQVTFRAKTVCVDLECHDGDIHPNPQDEQDVSNVEWQGQAVRQQRPQAAWEQSEDGGAGWKGAGARSRSPVRDRQQKQGRSSRSPLRDRARGRGDESRTSSLVGGVAQQSPPRDGGRSHFSRVSSFNTFFIPAELSLDWKHL